MTLATKQIRRFTRNRISVSKEVRSQLRIRNNLERSFFKRLTSLFGRFINTRAFIYKEFGQYDQSIASRDLLEELYPALQSHYRRVYKTIFETNNAKNSFQELKDDILVFDRNKDLEPFLQEYFKSRELILSGISASIARRIDKIIKDGRAEGLTLTQIARNIDVKVRPITRTRAATIARTETHNAASRAHHRYYKEVEKDYGSKLVKRWASTNDARTRSAHSLANGQIRDMNEDFLVGGALMSHAGDPRGGARNVINCRCVIIYVDEQDVVLN
tara:strand:- start:681 stop:1502 length:822 start_codon:yes stop_codon:yes gene_type:complete